MKTHPSPSSVGKGQLSSAEHVGVFLNFYSPDLEREFQVHNYRTKLSPLNVGMYVLFPSFYIGLYWARFLSTDYQNRDLWTAFIVSVVCYVVSNAAVVTTMIYSKPERVVQLSISFLTLTAAFTTLFCYGSVFYIHHSSHSCHPMSLFTRGCDRNDLPVDMLYASMFIGVIAMLAFPYLPWNMVLIFHVACLVVSVTIGAQYHNIQTSLLIIIGVLFSTGLIMTNRNDAINSFFLSKGIERQKENEQQAMLSDRLRRMISGVAHDLKSPLAALSLGCETMQQIYQNVTTILQTQQQQQQDPTRPSPSAKTNLHRQCEDVVETMKDVASWMETSKNSMSTIISRCVDVNQALNGCPLNPTYSEVNVRAEIDQTVEKFATENAQQVDIHLHFDVVAMTRPVPGGGPPAKHFITDRFWLQESLACLLSNAIKFSDFSEGQRRDIVVKVYTLRRSRTAASTPTSFAQRSTRKLSASFRSSSNVTAEDSSVPVPELFIEVHDQGIGIDSDRERTLFQFSTDPYTSTTSSSSSQKDSYSGGSGLGLYTLACRVTALGGQYGYYPRPHPETGSVMWFSIPCAPAGKNSYLATGQIDGVHPVHMPPISAAAMPVLATIPEPAPAPSPLIAEAPDMLFSTPGDSNARQESERVTSEKSRVANKSAQYSVQETDSESTHVPHRSSSLRPDLTVTIPPNPTISTPRSIPRLRILVVDDSLPIRKMVSMILRQQQHEVVTAMNGKEALQMLLWALEGREANSDKNAVKSVGSNSESSKTNSEKLAAAGFDLVLMDIQMPVMDGIEAVTLYRQHERSHSSSLRVSALGLSTLPIVGMSACSDVEVMEKALQVGMTAFLAKPFQLKDFQDIVSRVLSS